jgi:hypothetical protein
MPRVDGSILQKLAPLVLALSQRIGFDTAILNHLLDLLETLRSPKLKEYARSIVHKSSNSRFWQSSTSNSIDF